MFNEIAIIYCFWILWYVLNRKSIIVMVWMSNICTNDVLNANVDVDGVLKAVSSLSPTCYLVLVVFMFIVYVLSSLISLLTRNWGVVLVLVHIGKYMANLKSQSRTQHTVGGIDGIDANQYMIKWVKLHTPYNTTVNSVYSERVGAAKSVHLSRVFTINVFNLTIN
jgi:hypothetical protein